MKLIVQKDDFGCAISCVAQILGLNYQTTKKLFSKNFCAKNKGFSCRDITSVFNKVGLKYYYFYLKPKLRQRIYQDKTIVFIKRSKKYPNGHYLCRLGNFWFDPWINFLKEHNLKNAKVGLRKRLPGKPIYMITKI